MRKVEKYALYVGILLIFVGAFIPKISQVTGIISSFCFGITYVTALIKQKQKKGKISPISFLLCSGTLIWIVLSQFVKSPYVSLFGSGVIYAYFMNIQYEMLGKVQKSLIFLAVMALGTKFGGIVYPSKIIDVLNFVFLLIIIFKFLDPILEQIGQAHRKKRLEQEGKEKEGESDGRREIETGCGEPHA